jgi:dethiobiotin synthetase
MQGLFVTATDTDVGKSVLSAALVAAMREAGREAVAYKPALTGTDESPETGARTPALTDTGLPPETGTGTPALTSADEPPEAVADTRALTSADEQPVSHWPPDDELLSLAGGGDPETIAPLRFGPAVSPHLAAQLAGTPIDPDAVLAAARQRAAEPNVELLVVEGVGGLLVPLHGGYVVRDLAVALGLPLLIAARPGLGTINHTLLTLESARAAGLEVAAVVLTPWTSQPTEMEESNRATIAELGEVEVATLAHIEAPDPALLAGAGGQLPWRRWIG